MRLCRAPLSAPPVYLPRRGIARRSTISTLSKYARMGSIRRPHDPAWSWSSPCCAKADAVRHYPPTRATPWPATPAGTEGLDRIRAPSATGSATTQLRSLRVPRNCLSRPGASDPVGNNAFPSASFKPPGDWTFILKGAGRAPDDLSRRSTAQACASQRHAITPGALVSASRRPHPSSTFILPGQTGP